MMEVKYTTQRLDHLGIVAGICDEIGLVGQIDRLVPAPRRQVSVGQAVKAIILNALGFVGRPLYLTPEFWDHKPVEMLIGPGITADMLNDDSLGRALDALFDAGLTEVFAQVASGALRHFGIEHRFVHLDFSSFHLHGEYDQSTQQTPGMIRITQGYSRDHRPDLKQVVVALITSYRSALPCWIQALDGNTSDTRAVFPIVQAYIQNLSAEKLPYFVVDSALYSADNLHALAEVKWVSRVPKRLALEQYLEREVDVAAMQESAMEGYRYMEVGTWYGGVRQRWLVVYCEEAARQDKEALAKAIQKEREKAEQAMRRLARKTFSSKEALQEAVVQKARKSRYHKLTFTAKPRPRYRQRGRPPEDATPVRVDWRLTTWCIEEDNEAIKEAEARCGKFVLATNELDEKTLSSEQMLEAYKGQGVGPERGFRFLKDPLFFADSLFLKSPRRIMALIMVMGLALLIYALAEHKVRRELAARGETIPSQVGKPTQRPTMRRIFQLFEGIDVVVVQTPQGVRRHVTNLTDLHRHIIRLLGPAVEKYYTGPL